MTSNNQISSVLLLILIGLGIYFLLNPYDKFSNSDKIEEFNDLSIVKNDGQLNYQNFDSQQPVYNSQQPVYNSQQPEYNSQQPEYNPPQPEYNPPQPEYNPPQPTYNSQQPTYNSQQPTYNSQQPTYNSQQPTYNSQQPTYNSQQPTYNSQQPTLKINDTELNDLPDISDNILNDIINESMPSQILYDPKIHLSSADINSLTDIPGFNPNDEDFDYGVSDLTSAFIPSLPPGTKPDVIDFKKNNVEKYNAKDFLPKQVNDEWFETDFSLAKYQLNDDKLINTEKYIIGINTVGESLKNATYDIRGTIPNPKFIVSPWNNSTYEPDFNLKPLC